MIRVRQLSSIALLVGVACQGLGAGCSSKGDSNGNNGNGNPNDQPGDTPGQTDPGNQKPSNPSPRQVKITASGMPKSKAPGTMSITNPTADEYDGMGVHSGESVVLGLKIKLTGISINEGAPGQPNQRGGMLFDWSASPKELAIENGFSGQIEDSTPLALQPGRYQVLQVSYLSQYSLKAYAYLDTDKNGEVDKTIYTSATGVKAVANKVAPADLADLDYTFFGFTYSHNADSVTASTTTSSDVTMLPSPLVVAGNGGAGDGDGGDAADGGSGGDADADSDASEADASADGGASGDVSISLFIDSYRVVKVWDGVAAGGSDFVSVIFPQGVGESRTNQYGVALTQLYPFGQPAFGLDYIPTFAFANASSYSSESYLIAPHAPFAVESAQAISFIFDGAGVPVIGRTRVNPGNASLRLGQAARMFEPMLGDASTPAYRYYVEYGIKNGDGVDDGGMYYNNDPAMAGHIVEGFRRLPNLGDTTDVTIKDGPRCNAEYNYCFGDRTAVIRRVR